MKPDNIILHVEDDPNDVELVGMAFRKANAPSRLIVAKDGDEAVDYLAGNGTCSDREANPFPALVLLDMKLPRTSGLEVLTWIRSHPQPHIKRLPVVILTSSNQTQDIDRAYDLGVNSYLVKPADLKMLVELARYIQHYWMQLNIKSVAK